MSFWDSDKIDDLIINRIIWATMILGVVFALGSAGYHYIEGMTLFDGFYMTFITITTIGFAELQELSNAGRLLTIVVFVMGIGVISYIASQSTQLLFESKIFRLRTMKKKLQKAENHYIICGYGRTGQRIADILDEAGLPVVIIEWDEDEIDILNSKNFLYVNGDAKKESILQKAGIKNAKGMVCALSNDQDNVFTALMARDINEEIFIIVRTNESEHTKKILRSAADKIISPYEIGAERIANIILRPHVDQFINTITDKDQNYIFDEAKVSANSDFAGKSLQKNRIRQKYSVVVIAIASDEKNNIQFNPGGDAIINAGDSLIVMGTTDHITELRHKGCKDERNLKERVDDQFYSDLLLNKFK